MSFRLDEEGRKIRSWVYESNALTSVDIKVWSLSALGVPFGYHLLGF